MSAGETPSTYAGQLVTLARAFVGERSLAVGIFHAWVNGSSLEKRIVAILNTTRETLNTRFLHFLKPFGVCLLLALPLLFLHTAVGEIVGKAIARDTARDRFQGMWVSETISGDVAEDPEPQKFGITPDMTVENWDGTDGFLYGRAYVVSESPLLQPTTELWRIDPRPEPGSPDRYCAYYRR